MSPARPSLSVHNYKLLPWQVGVIYLCFQMSVTSDRIYFNWDFINSDLRPYVFINRSVRMDV